MGFFIKLITCLLVLPSALANPHIHSKSTHNTSGRNCKDYLIPITATATVFTPALAPFSDNYDVNTFMNAINARDAATSFHPFSGTANYTGSYKIAGTICTPKDETANAKTLIIATHGLTYDRSYWDIREHPEDYSFVDYAISRGYFIFFYDRLGSGLSSKPLGTSLDIQTPMQVSILAALTTALKSGLPSSTAPVPTHILQIGHSYGSALLNGLLALPSGPSLADAAIFTGLAWDLTIGTFGFLYEFVFRIASTLDKKWKDRDNGYWLYADMYAEAGVFLYNGSYDKDVLLWSDARKNPASAVEIATLTGGLGVVEGFAGPVMVIAAEHDFVCGNNCNDILAATTPLIFPNAQLEVLVHPGVGHCINLSFNATGAYRAILDFVGSHGL